jgi:cytochrome c peroxidase
MAHGLRQVWPAALLAALGTSGPLSPGRQAGDVPPAFTVEILDRMSQFPGGLGPLPSPPEPPDNPPSASKIELGRLLFHDKRLSRDYSMSCATCHDPAKAYSDGRKRAVGAGEKILERRSPSLLNAAYNRLQFWDGRARTLEEQARGPILSAKEMGIPDRRTLVERLLEVPEYEVKFREAFGGEVSFEDVTRAIAAFERTLVTPDSPFDRYALGDKQALTTQQKRGLILFVGKAACTECHNGANFTDNKFHPLGLLPGEDESGDLGRFALTKNPADLRSFKTPSLRSAALESHYMHDGSIATLPEVIDFYDEGGGRGPKCALIFKLRLTTSEKEDLLAFLQALVGRMPEDGIGDQADEKDAGEK